MTESAYRHRALSRWLILGAGIIVLCLAAAYFFARKEQTLLYTGSKRMLE